MREQGIPLLVKETLRNILGNNVIYYREQRIESEIFSGSIAMERDNTPPGRHLRCSNIVKIVIHKKFLIIGIFQHIEKITPKSLLFSFIGFSTDEVSASEAYLSNILTNLCIALYCILLYCIVLGCVVLLIYCYVDIIQCNAMHKFVGVLDNPPLKCPLSLRNSSRRKRLRRPPF